MWEATYFSLERRQDLAEDHTKSGAFAVPLHVRTGGASPHRPKADHSGARSITLKPQRHK